MFEFHALTFYKGIFLKHNIFISTAFHGLKENIFLSKILLLKFLWNNKNVNSVKKQPLQYIY